MNIMKKKTDWEKLRRLANWVMEQEPFDGAWKHDRVWTNKRDESHCLKIYIDGDYVSVMEFLDGDKVMGVTISSRECLIMPALSEENPYIKDLKPIIENIDTLIRRVRRKVKNRDTSEDEANAQERQKEQIAELEEKLKKLKGKTQ